MINNPLSYAQERKLKNSILEKLNVKFSNSPKCKKYYDKKILMKSLSRKIRNEILKVVDIGPDKNDRVKWSGNIEHIADYIKSLTMKIKLAYLEKQP